MTDMHHPNTLPLLTHWNINPDTATEDTGNPTDLAACIRRNLATSAERTPRRYRDAIPTQTAALEWATTVVGAGVRMATGAMRLDTGPSLAIIGPVGSGKTHEAHGLLRLVAASGISGRIAAATAPTLYASLRPEGGATFEAWADAPLLLVDDLGAARMTEWTEEVTYRLIDHRYEQMLPTLITSNIPLPNLADMLGARVASRLREMCRLLPIVRTDRREQAR